MTSIDDLRSTAELDILAQARCILARSSSLSSTIGNVNIPQDSPSMLHGSNSASFSLLSNNSHIESISRGTPGSYTSCTPSSGAAAGYGSLFQDSFVSVAGGLLPGGGTTPSPSMHQVSEAVVDQLLAKMAQLEKENMELRKSPSNTMSHGSKRTRAEGKYVAARNIDGTFHDIARQLDDFPEARFWYREDWGDADDEDALEPGKATGPRGSSRMAKGENVRFGFITHTDGTVVNGHRIKEIGDHFREFCLLLKAKNMCPVKWRGGASADVKQACYRWLRSHCFELQLCENNWKSDVFAIMAYPAWKQRNLTKGKGDTGTQKHDIRSAAKGKGKEIEIIPTALLEQARWLIDDKPPDSVGNSESIPSAPPESNVSDNVITNTEPERGAKRPRLDAAVESSTPSTSVPTKDHAPIIMGTGTPSAADTNSAAIQPEAVGTQIPDALAGWWQAADEPPPGQAGTSAVVVPAAVIKRAPARVKKEWPPTLAYNKLKDVCARYWAAENPTKTKTDFDNVYKALPAAGKKEMKEKGQLADKLTAMATAT